MNLNRVWAVTKRHLYYFKHSLDRLSDGFYWPAFDIVVWGLTSKYFQASGQQAPVLVGMVLTGLVFWQTVWRAQHDITVSLLDEIWQQNLVNMFGSPLKLKEWIAGVFLLGFLKNILSVAFMIFLVKVLYAFNITVIGLGLVPFLANLLFTGWWVGLLVAAIIILGGTRIQTFAWVGASIIMPFSAIYYPIETLPQWGQTISKGLPTSYIFTGMRAVLQTQKIPLEKLLIAFGLNLVYFGLSLVVFRLCFNLSKNRGLSQVE